MLARSPFSCIIYPLAVCLLSFSAASPLSPAPPLTPSLNAFIPQPPVNASLSARNSECFSTYSFLPLLHPARIFYRTCENVLRDLQASRPATRTFGSLSDSDEFGPWVWPSFRPGQRCYISLHSAELGNTITLRLIDIAWKATLILRDCEARLYGGRKWIGNGAGGVPGEFYVRVAGLPPVDEPGS